MWEGRQVKNMYHFKATYLDFVTDKEIDVEIEIDMSPFGADDFHGESPESVVWRWALGRAIDAKLEGQMFTRLELIGC